jgi:hypothetical protein
MICKRPEAVMNLRGPDRFDAATRRIPEPATAFVQVPVCFAQVESE